MPTPTPPLFVLETMKKVLCQAFGYPEHFAASYASMVSHTAIGHDHTYDIRYTLPSLTVERTTATASGITTRVTRGQQETITQALSHPAIVTTLYNEWIHWTQQDPFVRSMASYEAWRDLMAHHPGKKDPLLVLAFAQVTAYVKALTSSRSQSVAPPQMTPRTLPIKTVSFPNKTLAVADICTALRYWSTSPHPDTALYEAWRKVIVALPGSVDRRLYDALLEAAYTAQYAQGVVQALSLGANPFIYIQALFPANHPKPEDAETNVAWHVHTAQNQQLEAGYAWIQSRLAKPDTGAKPSTAAPFSAYVKHLETLAKDRHVVGFSSHIMPPEVCFLTRLLQRYPSLKHTEAADMLLAIAYRYSCPEGIQTAFQYGANPASLEKSTWICFPAALAQSPGFQACAQQVSQAFLHSRDNPLHQGASPTTRPTFAHSKEILGSTPAQRNGSRAKDTTERAGGLSNWWSTHVSRVLHPNASAIL